MDSPFAARFRHHQCTLHDLVVLPFKDERPTCTSRLEYAVWQGDAAGHAQRADRTPRSRNTALLILVLRELDKPPYGPRDVDPCSRGVKTWINAMPLMASP